MIAVMVESNVDVEDVTVLERSLIWNAMTDDFIRRGANGFGKVGIVER